MSLSRFQRIYHGFEHGGLRVVIDPDRSGDERRAAGDIVHTDSGRAVGWLLRWLYEREGELYVNQHSQHIDEEFRGTGFTPALIRHVEPRFRDLGVRATTIHAHNIGGLIWGRFGYDLDLYGIEGATREQRVARAVARMFDPGAQSGRRSRRFPPWPKRLPNAHRALREVERQGGEEALAAQELRARIPTEEQIRSGQLDGTFTHPAEIVAFEAHGVRVGASVMRWAHWDGIKFLDPPRG